MKEELTSDMQNCDSATNSDCDDRNSLPAYLSNPSDKLYEKPEKLQNRIKLIEAIQEKIDNDKLFICLDIEAYERNHDYLTEFGWCIFKKNGEIIVTRHAIVEEYINYHNGRYVPDNKSNFNFGKSEVKKLNNVYRDLKKDIEKVNYLVGHGINNDIRFLKKIKVDVSKFKKLSTANSIGDYGIIETMDLFSGFFLSKPVSLEKCLRKLEIPYEKLHNAGNDAYYTMQVFLEIIKRFSFSSNRQYEQVMNYKPPKKIKSSNNKNNKNNGNGNNISNGNNGNNGNIERDQSNDDVILIDAVEKDNNVNSNGNRNSQNGNMINNSNNNNSNNNNNNNHYNYNYNNNNKGFNKNNRSNNNSNRNINKKNSQTHNRNRRMNHKQSFIRSKSNNFNNNTN